MQTATIVEKENIGGLKFAQREVLSSAEEMKQRNADLLQATRLGNAYHGKIKIIFEAEDGVKQVETTIWATTDKVVTLKGGVHIPIHCIHRVMIY